MVNEKMFSITCNSVRLSDNQSVNSIKLCHFQVSDLQKKYGAVNLI